VSAVPAAACEGAEPFALRVLGDSMAPEFLDGDIVVVEPGGAARDGSFVLAHHDGEWIFRQLVQRPGHWCLRALNPVFGECRLDSLDAVRGVIIQKAVPGRRRLSKRYR